MSDLKQHACEAADQQEAAFVRNMATHQKASIGAAYVQLVRIFPELIISSDQTKLLLGGYEWDVYASGISVVDGSISYSLTDGLYMVYDLPSLGRFFRAKDWLANTRISP